jgi:hypothetical protein
MSKPKTISKKARAYELFVKGYGPYSAEVRNLGLKGSTRASYYAEWKAAGYPRPDTEELDNDFIPRGRNALSEASLAVEQPSNEVDNIEEQEVVTNDAEIEFVEEEDKSSEAEKSDETDLGSGEDGNGKQPAKGGRKLRTMVAGQGLDIAVTLSLKTLSLYQYAASLNKDKLTLGDFLDTCVEDYYKGRGLDLGLVELGGNGHHG